MTLIFTETMRHLQSGAGVKRNRRKILISIERKRQLDDNKDDRMKWMKIKRLMMKRGDWKRKMRG